MSGDTAASDEASGEGARTALGAQAWSLPVHLVVSVVVGVLGALLVAGPEPSWVLRELPGYDNTDQWGAIYLHHHHHARLLAGEWPGFDPGQMVPEGLPLAALHGGNTLEMWLSGLMRLLLPWPAWFGVAHLAWTPLLVVAFQPLGCRLWGRGGPAVAAGLAWALWPFHLGEIAAGRLTQVALLGLPLAVAGLLDLGKGRYRAAAVGMALTALGYWFYGLFLALLSPWFLLNARREGHRVGPVLRDALRAGGGALLLVAPWLVVALWPRLAGGWVPDPGGGPGGASPVFDMALKLEGPLPRSARGWWPWAWTAGVLVTCWTGRRRALWGGLAATAVVFALGPATRVGGLDWHLPYELLWSVVPMLSRLNHPVRWLGVAGLFVVVLATDGVARRWAWAAWLLPLGVAVQLYATGGLPLVHHAEEIPDHWRALDEVAAEGGVIVVPIGHAAESIRAVHLHGRPLLGGMVEGLVWARPPAWTERIETNAVLSQLARVSRGEVTTLVVPDSDLQAVRALGFRTVVADLGLVQRSPGGDPAAVRRVLTQALGAPLYDDGVGLIWHLPTQGTDRSVGRLPPVWPQP